MNISQYAYELYKIDWEQSHNISGKRKLEAYREYTQLCLEEEADPLTMQYSSLSYSTFEDFLEEHGYHGELYVCYDEFLNAEYLDDGYMEYLLQDSNLIDARNEDIQTNYSNTLN